MASAALFPDDSPQSSEKSSGKLSVLDRLTSPTVDGGHNATPKTAERLDLGDQRTLRTPSEGILRRTELREAGNDPLGLSVGSPAGLDSPPVQRPGGRKPLTQGRHATPPVRRSTAAELETCIQQCLTDSKASKAIRKLVQVSDLIGLISVALQMEKDDTQPITEVEEQFSRLSVTLAKLLANDEVKESSEVMYWLRLFNVHVNRHLQEIVLLTDSDKQAPAYYDNIMSENQRLLDTISDLKNVIVDLQDELEVFHERDHHQTMEILQEKQQTRGIELAGSIDAGPEEAELLRLLRNPPPPLVNVAQAEDVLRRLDAARETVVEIKAGDARLKGRLTS